ncbi:MAG: nicotinate-nicotinamide nucleotide adenylyltransferase [Helicobacter sp.]|nr:nicotinate-nicotinamide nucleotide adenylyltransferase [Helicobacter sp.]
MDITIYGGSFDPPHIAHIKIIELAISELRPDLLIILVAHHNPLKEPPRFSELTRLEWMQKLCDMPNVEVSDLEIKHKITNTIDSIKLIKKRLNPTNINLIIGSDYAQSLHLWDGFNELREHVNFVLIKRVGFANLTNPHVSFTKILILDIKEEISSTDIRANLRLDLTPSAIANSVKELLKP